VLAHEERYRPIVVCELLEGKMRYLCILIFLLGIGGTGSAQTGAVAQVARESQSSRPTVAVAEFSGADPATGKFLSDTLLTDLAQSRQMRMVERTEIRKAMDELKLQDSLVFEPQQARELGRLIRADEVIVGSYLISDGQIMVNARLLDLATGRVVSGGASNVTADSRRLFTAVHRLAHLLHHRVTGTDLVIDGEGAETSDFGDIASVPARHIGQPTSSRATPTAPGRVETGSGPSSYRVHESGDAAADRDDNSASNRTAAPPIVVQVPQPIYVPTYYDYPYPYPYYYPYSAFSFSLGFGFGSRHAFFPRFGFSGHGGFSGRAGFSGHGFRGRR